MSQIQSMGPLFDICKNYHRGNEQSVKANKVADKHKVSARNQIMEILAWNGKPDLTCEELERAIGLSHQTCSARISELKREGKIKQVGVRKTRSGSEAAVYQLT